MKALTRSRSADFHRATMLRLLIAAILIYWFWEPLRPVRTVTGEALSTTAEIIRR
jgi:hypothetical protein